MPHTTRPSISRTEQMRRTGTAALLTIAAVAFVTTGYLFSAGTHTLIWIVAVAAAGSLWLGADRTSRTPHTAPVRCHTASHRRR
jgi:hypothetical protein